MPTSSRGPRGRHANSVHAAPPPDEYRHLPSRQRRNPGADDRRLDAGGDGRSHGLQDERGERSLLAKEFDLSAIVEDRQVSAAGYTPVFASPHGLKPLPSTTGAPTGQTAIVLAPALISLTSGTTGRPQAAVIDHERMLLRSTFDAERLSGPLLNPLPLSLAALARTCSRRCFRAREFISFRCCSRPSSSPIPC